MFKMSYGQARWRPYCPISGHLNFFCEETPKKAKTGYFPHFGKLLKYCYCNIYPGYHHVKADVLTVRKMCNIRGWWASQTVLCPAKVERVGKNCFVPENRRCQKKITLIQFWKFGSETNSSCKQPHWAELLFVSDLKSQNWTSVIFFWHLLSTEKFIEICTDFEGL